MAYVAKRRGRKAKAQPTVEASSALATAPIAAEAAVAQAAPAPAKRRRRASVGGHALKLGAPSREGFQRRWFNDDGNRLATADDLGYDHVSDTGLKTSSPGSRVSRLVGTQPNGEPLHAFLMETPDELYAEGLAEKEAVCRLTDEAILAGKDSTGTVSPDSPKETYGHGSIRTD